MQSSRGARYRLRAEWYTALVLLLPQRDHEPLVWLYYRFTLISNDVQELLCERGIAVTYEAMHQWCLKFGQDSANQLRRRFFLL